MYRPIPVFVINYEIGNNRLKGIFREFSGRDEFEINIFQVNEYEGEGSALFNLLYNVFNDSTKGNDVVIMCESNHQFSKEYNKDYFFECISKARSKNADILLGGVSWIRTPVQISENLFWVEDFSGLQFTCIFKNFYESILANSCNRANIDNFGILKRAASKLLIHPFISIKREFGPIYLSYEEDHVLGRSFSNLQKQLRLLKVVKLHYNTLHY